MLNMMLPYSIIVSKITSITFPLNDIPVLFENASEMKIGKQLHGLTVLRYLLNIERNYSKFERCSN